MMTLLRRAVLSVFAVVLLLVLAGSSPVFAQSPWWRLSSGSRPTNLQSGLATNEVQDVMVTETEGEFLLVEPAEFKFVALPVTATPEEVQVGLETIYGAGNVTVTGSKPYVVTFKGVRGGRPVPLMLGLGATVTEAVKGKPDGEVVVTAANLGDASLISDEPHQVKIADALPLGLEAVSIEAVAGNHGGEERGHMSCSLKPLSCTFETGERKNTKGEIEIIPGFLPPYDQIEILIGVVVKGAETEEMNDASVSGGEGYVCNEVAAGSGKFKDGFCLQETGGGSFERVSTGAVAGASFRRPLAVGGPPASFGVEDDELTPEEEGGSPDTQAGSHPFQLSSTLTLNQTADANPVELPKDLYAKAPPGLIGNPTPVPQCTIGQFLTVTAKEDHCSPDTAVGVVMVTINRPETVTSPGVETVTVPLFNVEPTVGEPARFGFLIVGVPTFLDASVRSGGDYGVTLGSANITEAAGFLSFKPTLWGVPGDPSHDNARGWGCLEKARGEPLAAACNPLGAHHPPPFLSLPTSCPKNPLTLEPERLRTSIEGDSWAEPRRPGERLSFPGEPMPAMDGCNRMQFVPEIKVSPDGQAASTPTGLTVDVHVPQDGQLNPTGLANSNIRDIAVKLPRGVAINPSSGDGLEACSEGLVGFTGFGEFPTEPGVSDPLFSSYLPGSVAALAAGDQELFEPGKNFCANASKVATVRFKTPLLPNPLEGAVYLAAQNANPFGSLVALYVVAEDPVSGSLVKLAGEVQLCQGAGEVIAGMTCEGAGQLVSTFENTPQLAFEDAELHFFGGERAPLATPAHCGTYTTNATFTPWSGNPPVKSSSSFEVIAGPNGTPCPGVTLPFSPSLTGGATNIQAGEFSPFTLTMSRLPGEQNLQSVEAKLPPGLSGILSNIELCPEPRANEGACGPNSLIGETTVSVGVGGDPFTDSGGKFYLTGPYNGTGACKVGEPDCAPFGITFEVPAKAGPFDLAKTAKNHPACDCVLVRGKIEINPITAAITITSNPPGSPDAIPTMLEGIPLEIQHVNAITTRHDFQFNPTNCNKMEVTGTLHSSEGGTDTIKVPFQVTNCATLKFAPKFTASTSGKTSKAKGASLSVKLTYPKAPFGTQANIARVKVDLPKQLPSRLTTLQKACTAAQFEANPAGCPSASLIGHAKAITPLVPVPLEGPAYFVSHGGEAFPSLIMVLQGYGVTVDLVGTTFISKAGITSSTFKTVPDAPVGSFEVTLPEGKFSALAANGNLCKSASKLRMPTEFVAQNGSKINQSTKISVTACPKHKTRHARKTGKHAKK